jgi:hypothetical protein
MSDLCRLIWCALIGLFRSRAALEAEFQLNVLRRKSPKRLAFSNVDRLVFAGLYRVAPGVLDALKILKPQTVIHWHRAGFRAYWRWKSRPHGGRPKKPADIRQLIRDMSAANPLWGAPRIHGELLKLGIDIGQTTVAKYMARRRQPPSQGWKTFLRNHTDGIASMDLFVVPTISFRLLYGFLILQHSRRELLWLGVTARPSARWIARQLTEAYGWQQTPRCIVRDRDCVYGDVVIQRLRAWVSGIGRSRHGRHGKTDIRKGSLVRSDGIVLTMLLCSANGICAICSILTKNTTTNLVRTYRCTRTRRSRVLRRPRDASSGRTAPPIFQSVNFRQGQRTRQPSGANSQSYRQRLVRSARQALSHLI